MLVKDYILFFSCSGRLDEHHPVTCRLVGTVIILARTITTEKLQHNSQILITENRNIPVHIEQYKQDILVVYVQYVHPNWLTTDSFNQSPRQYSMCTFAYIIHNSDLNPFPFKP
jgi:hypothetical protein